MRYQAWTLGCVLLGALLLPACTLKDTSKDKPAPNSIEDRESPPPTGTPDNPGAPNPSP